MKPSLNAFIGYTYQEYIALYLLTKMDVERQIKRIEIEPKVDNNFDDAEITIKNDTIFCQMKDIDNIDINDVKIEEKVIFINGSSHTLSDNSNVLFFKNINIKNNSTFLGIPAYEYSNVFIVSLSRSEIRDQISELYKDNIKREPIICRFFADHLDSRKLIIKREDLPIIEIFNTTLLEHTVYLGNSHLKFKKILFIEGKPGIGKSHLVNCLSKDFKNNLVYRFWVSNQDKDYKERLVFDNFISNISKELFNDYAHRTENEIIQKLYSENKTVIIDGFDHIENYNNGDLSRYIQFIDLLKEKCKTIVLSRPLKSKLYWAKRVLSNWNYDQTKKVLDELYHITDYKIFNEIFNLTQGYPILVRFIAIHYKTFNSIPQLRDLDSIEDYYSKVIIEVNMKIALSLFISSRSYFMESEIPQFLDEELSNYVKEFIKSYPYLFEIRLNRISLFHDSFNTFLRNQKIDFFQRETIVKQIVYKSIMKGDLRFLSRFTYYNLEHDMKLNVIRKFTSLDCFKKLIINAIDFESIRAFYHQIRESINEFDPDELEIKNYYDLSLIINIVDREHVTNINSFLYTYIKCLLFNGFTEEDITSSEYLFSMFYFIRTNDVTLLYNLTNDDHYNTNFFYENLQDDIQSEESYFEVHHKPLNLKTIEKLLNKKTEYETSKLVTLILENLYINKTSIEEFKELASCIEYYMSGNEVKSIGILKNILHTYDVRSFYAEIILEEAKNKITSLGIGTEQNEYRTLSLKEYIVKYSNIGSFKMWVAILNFMRLSLHDSRKIDLSSITLFWFMYHERKDYSVISLDVALKAFEEKGFITEFESLRLIIFIQSMSEKGIRSLLLDYITLHEPDIFLSLLDKFIFTDLQISWFDLPKKYLDILPDNIFQYELKRILGYNRHTKEIDFKDIENLHNSTRWNQFIHILYLTDYKIKIHLSHPQFNKVKKFKNILKIDTNKDEQERYKEDRVQRFNQGILDSKDIGFIKENKLDISIIAGYTDGNYSLFSDLGIYRVYDKRTVRKHTLNILHNAILGKIRTINMYGNLYNFPGNLPRFIIDYKVKVNFEDLFNSFVCFLDISLLNSIKLSKK